MDTLNSRIDKILSNTKIQVKEVIETHLDTVIEAADERLKNAPKPAEANLLKQVTKLVQQQQLGYEFMLKNMERTLMRSSNNKMRNKKHNLGLHMSLKPRNRPPSPKPDQG